MSSTAMTLVVTGGGVLLSGLISFLIASMRIGEYKGKVDRACTDISELKSEQKEIRDKVIACETSLKEREPLTKKKSPVALTERGAKVLSESGGQKFIDDNFEELNKEVENLKPKTAYDVQEFSKQILTGWQMDERLNSIKDYLFKEGMEIADAIDVMGIELRDRILKSKGWSVDDVDKYMPTQDQ